MTAKCHLNDDLDWANVLAEQIIADYVGRPNYNGAEKTIAARLRQLKLEIEAETIHRLVAEANHVVAQS